MSNMQKVRAILSSILILLFLFLAMSGALLYFFKTGMILGIARYALREAHFVVAITMSVLILIHLILNLKVYFSELRALFKRKRNAER